MGQAVPMPLTFLFLLLESSAETPLERYADLVKVAPALNIQFTSSRLNGTILYQPKVGLRFSATSKGLDYLQVQGFGQQTELDRTSKTYDSLSISAVGKPDSRISAATQAFPTWIFSGDLRNLIPKDAAFKEEGIIKVGSQSGTRYHFRTEGSGEFSDVDLVLQTSGRPLKLHLSGSSMSGAYDFTWTFSRFEPVAKPKASLFKLTIPDGYTPFSTDTVYAAFSDQGKVPTAGWKGNDGKPLNPLARLPKGGLIALLGSDSDPSQAAQKSIERLRKSGVAVIVLSDKKAVFADGYDVGGFREMGISATPSFFRINGEGVIQAVWMGFDPAQATAFENEVRSGK